ncbi:Retrovirus-related Pol polyprotein from transposon TNT 1-94 [Vitis vinifera]|uniref:Retrovirus-related Pol polyprotein from transposon TNT 1-94 n=1 Tax=Vitis vinifera TaxID=29760 RepID=A0A438J504_VITVI|nr:Retrovirus-related Pol polyprotein from transposon TNT 1-94 [Vitis vinifera]
MAQIIGHNSSHSAWNALEKTFSSSSRARIMQLRLELQSTKKGSLSMIDYIMKVKGAADSLAAIGEPVSEQDQVMNLLGGLGSDYNAVVTAINIRDDKISIEAVHKVVEGGIMAVEDRIIPQTSATIPTEVVVEGVDMAKWRHNSNSSEKPQCQLCGKFGHTVQICYHRFDISYQSSQSSNTSPSNAGNPNSIPAMVASSNNLADDTWYLDSGASHHLTQSVGNLTSSSPYTGTDKVTIGNGKHLSISNTGSHRLLSDSRSFHLKKVFHVPFISANLISVAKFCSDNNALIEFRSNSFFVKDLHTKKVLAQGKLENGLYRFPVLNSKKVAFVGATNSSTFYSHNSSIFDNKVKLWHHRLGHASTDILAKSHRLPTHLSLSCASKPLELVHTDLWGPASVKSTSGARYFILFLDDYSRYTWFYPLQTKDQALPAFKKFKLQVENQFDAKIKCLQSDNGGEFRSFKTFLQQTGIFHRFSCPYNSAQNGRVERKHRHVVETGLALLAHASLPMEFWQYAFQTATFLINRMPSKVLQITPLISHFFKRFRITSLRVFGCLCYPFIRPYNSHKLQYRSVQSLFLGYSLHNKGFLCLDFLTGRVYITPHVVFDEGQFPLAKTHPLSPTKDTSTDTLTPAIITSFPSPTFCSNGSHTSSLSSSPSTSEASDSVSSPTVTPASSTLPEAIHEDQPPSPSPAPRMTTRLMRGITKKKTILDLSAVKISEPYTLKQALKDPNWIQAMDLEIAALHRNQTWDLVEQPSEVNLIGCKWVYKLKHKPDGSIERYKARLVAKGYNQTHGLDYFETFSPVVKAATIRIILTVALSFQWEIRQLDVHNAFLNGELEEQVYMSQSWLLGYYIPNQSVSIEEGSIWFETSTTSLSTTLIVLVYVDDIIITGCSSTQISSLIAKLDSIFTLRDLGQLSYFLGIEVSYHEGSMNLSQTKYVSDLLHRTEMFDTKPAKTPGAVGKNLSKFDGDPMDEVTQYRSVVGALQYLTITRPDIAFAVNKACQFMQQPTSAHWLSVKRILRYLKGTMQDGLLLSPSTNLTIEGFSDADWGAQPDDRRSSSGYLVYLGGNLVSWSSTKQKVVSRSSAESEYRGLALATAEIIWMQALLQELCVPILRFPCSDLHFIRDQVIRGKIQLHFVPTEDQPADLLTKHLTSSRFLSLKSQLCIAPRPFHLRGDDKPKIEEVVTDPT